MGGQWAEKCRVKIWTDELKNHKDDENSVLGVLQTRDACTQDVIYNNIIKHSQFNIHSCPFQLLTRIDSLCQKQLLTHPHTTSKMLANFTLTLHNIQALNSLYTYSYVALTQQYWKSLKRPGRLLDLLVFEEEQCLRYVIYLQYAHANFYNDTVQQVIFVG